MQLTHRNCWLNATTFALHTQAGDRDVYLHTLPMFHANGWGMPFAVTGVGGCHVVLRKVDGAEILDRVERHGVTLMCGAPAVVAAVLDAAAERSGPVPGRDQVRVVVAGAPPPTRTIERVETELGWELIQIYGLTETSPLLTVNRRRAEWDDMSPADRAVKLGRAGVPTLGTSVRIDAEGEVLARSNVVLEGYWNQPEATADALEGGWFHTGDGGVIDDDGYLAITDRKKDVIISGGENVSSIEVEDTLFSHPAVAEVAVIGIPSERWGETVTALVVLAEGASATEAELVPVLPRPAWPTTSAPRRWSSASTSTARPRASCRSSSSVRPTGRARSARCTRRPGGEGDGVARVTVPVEVFQGGELPPVCAKTGRAADADVPLTAAGAPGWTWLLLLAGVLPFLLVRWFRTERLDGLVPMSPEARAAVVSGARGGRLLTWAAVVILGGSILVNSAVVAAVGVVALALAGAASVYGLWRFVGGELSEDGATVTLTRVDPDFARLVEAGIRR